MPERIKRKDLKSLSGRTIFFDTNILLFLFNPAIDIESNSKKWQKDYSGLFAEIVIQKHPRCTSLFVLSEFYNRYLRIEASIQTNTKSESDSREFKKFRNSDEGLLVDKSIKEIIRSKLPGSGLSYLDINFNQQEILNLLDMPGLDFVDRIIVETCKKKNLVLLTDDADFRDIDIPILSLNPNMF